MTKNQKLLEQIRAEAKALHAECFNQRGIRQLLEEQVKLEMVEREQSAQFKDEAQRKFLYLLANTFTESTAAEAAGVELKTLRRWKKGDEVFAERWELAVEQGHHNLEDEAKRRAVDGVLKPVYYKGVKIDEVLDFSDSLLTTLLKAHMPEKYRENIKVDGKIEGGVTIDFAQRAIDVNNKLEAERAAERAAKEQTGDEAV